MLDPDLLRSFVALADAGGLTRAAERLHLTQSTVSFQIKRLEEQVGRALLTRTTRRVALTPVGEVLLGYARNILHLHEVARRTLAGTGSLSGTVRLGRSEDFASGGLANVLARFRQTYPRMRLEVEMGISRQLLATLDDGTLDPVLGKQPPGMRRGEVLWREPVVWAFGRETGQLSPKAPFPLALFPKGCVYRQAALALLREADRAFEIV